MNQGGKKMYLKFVRWDGDYALFKKASIMDLIMVYSYVDFISYALGIGEQTILVRSKALDKSKQSPN